MISTILTGGVAQAQPEPTTPSVTTETSVSPAESPTQDRVLGVMGPLTLIPDRGEPGEPFTATVTAAYPGVSLGRCGTITFLWDDDVLPGEVTEGDAEVLLSTAVPAAATPREHRVSATCGRAGQVSAPFTVPEPVTPTSAPERDAPGTPVTTTEPTTVTTTEPTTVAAEPASDRAGPPPATTTPPSMVIAGWVALALAAGALVLAGLGFSRLRKRGRPHPDTRVRAVRRPGPPPVLAVRETPAPGEATHAIRAEAHADTGTVTIREVDR